MFKRKDDKQDVLHHLNIKRGITSHFARTLKILQQKNVSSDGEECIFSNDYSNNLCNALEAVFLHGMKDSVSQKLTSLVLSSPQTPDSASVLNFWSVATKFTHGDVSTQLRSLSQITTEVGLCRAWVRLALNDGLMESYLQSMMVDGKALKNYYRSHAYLRDQEQPGILKNYLTGLMSLEFRLSCNSSVLNDWSNSTLQLAGVLDSTRAAPPPAAVPPGEAADDDDGGGRGRSVTPPPVLPPSAAAAAVNAATRDSVATLITSVAYGEANSIIVASSPPKSSRRNKKGGRATYKDLSSNDSIVAQRKNPNPPGPSSEGGQGEGTRGTTAMFSSMADVEEMRRRGAAAVSEMSVSPSEGSTSSHVSCPDPRVSHLSDVYPQPPTTVETRESNQAYDRVLRSGLSSAEDAGKPDDATKYNVPPPRSDTLSQSDLLRSGGFTPALPQPDILRSKQHSITSWATDSGRETDLESTTRYSSAIPTPALSHPQRGSSLTPVGSPVVLEAAASLDEIYAMPRRSRSRRVTVDDLNTMSPRASALSQNSFDDDDFDDIYSSKTDDFKEKDIVEGGGGGPNVKGPIATTKLSRENSPSSGVKKEQDLRLSRDSSAGSGIQRSYDEICSSLPSVKLDAAERDDILKKISQESAIQAEFERAKNEKRKEMTESAGFDYVASRDDSVTESEDIFHPAKTSQRQIISKVGTDDSEDLAAARLDEMYSSPPRPRSHRVATEESIYSISPVKEYFGNEEATPCPQPSEDLAMSPSQIGNSLSSMSMGGWSSDMMESSPLPGKQVPGAKDKSSRAESFATMLHTYQPHSDTPPTGATMNDIIQSLSPPDSDPDPMMASPQTDEHLQNINEDDEFQCQDSGLEDFEILESPENCVPGQVTADSSRMIFLYRIAQEVGLSHQNFTCRGCTRAIGFIYGPPRLCAFDGGLYCFECHENNEAYLPSAIVYNWDFRKQKVSVANYKFLQELEDQPLYDIEELNPKLYLHVPELNDVKKLREQLCFLKSYMFTCSQKNADSLRQKVWPREHLYEKKDLYSITDLLQIQSGALFKLIKEVTKFASSHVYDCPLCCQKGFVCEICGNPKVIYPFEVDTTVRCDVCKSVFHATCMTDSLPCPKCERWGRRRIKQGTNIHTSGNHPEDYGSPPIH